MSAQPERREFRRSKEPVVQTKRGKGAASKQELLKLERDAERELWADRKVRAEEADAREGEATGELHEKRAKEFRDSFPTEVPKGEHLLRDFECSLGGRVLAQGRMFVTKSSIFFISKVLANQTRVVIPFEDVTAVDRHNSALLIRDSIEISTRQRKYMFQSFVQRDIAHQALCEMWAAHHALVGDRGTERRRSAPAAVASADDPPSADRRTAEERVERAVGVVEILHPQKRMSASAVQHGDPSPVPLLPGETVARKFPDVTWYNALGGQVAGYAVCTNFSFIFAPFDAKNEAVRTEFGTARLLVPFADVFRVKKVQSKLDSIAGQQAIRQCELWCKSFRRVRVGLPPGTKQRQALLEQVSNGMAFSPAACFAQEFRKASVMSAKSAKRRVPDGAWGPRFDSAREYERLIGGLKDPSVSARWRMTTVNEEYRLCETYPRVLVVPSAVTDGQLRNISGFRSKGRIPVLSWLDASTGAALCRCAQPSWGLRTRTRCRDDENLLEAIARANPNSEEGGVPLLAVYDARPFANAVANAAKGQGYEDAANYPGVRLEFCGISNIHVMRKAHESLFEAVTTPDIGGHLFSRAEPWIAHISLILESVGNIVKDISAKKNSVVVHCSDGWDRTAQLTALSCLLLDPFYRSMDGFVFLLEKEFLSFGFKAHQRLGFAPKKEDERSPVFLQFMECVRQVLYQYPCSFEFNESFLVAILDAVYSGKYGTFLFNCESERAAAGVYESTLSLWDALACRKRGFVNMLYAYRDEAAGGGVLVPCSSPLRLTIWGAYYLRSQHASSSVSVASSPDTRTDCLLAVVRRLGVSKQ